MSDERRILVVEDDAELRSLSCLLLQEEGFDVVAAPDPAAAIQALSRMDAPPDMILVDVYLRDGDADSVLSALRAQPGCGAIPIILGCDRRPSAAPHKPLPAVELRRPFGMGDLLWMIRSVFFFPIAHPR